MGISEIINIEREYKGVKYEIKGYIRYGTPVGSYIGIDNKIYLNDNLINLYEKYPLDFTRVNHILGYKIRPCTTKVIVGDDEIDIENREYKYTTLRYNVNVNEEDKYLRVEIHHYYHGSDVYIVEKTILEVIDYIKKLQKIKKGEMNNGCNEYYI